MTEPVRGAFLRNCAPRTTGGPARHGVGGAARENGAVMTNVSSLRPVRHDYITDLVVREGAVEIAALSAALGVSAATIRRDIESLEHCGVVRRVHGGAVRAGSRTVETDAVEGPPEPPAAPRAAQDAGLAALAAACAAAREARLQAPPSRARCVRA